MPSITRVAVSLVGLVGLVVAGLGPVSPAQAAVPVPTSEYVVQVAPGLGTVDAAVTGLVATLGGEVTHTYEHVLDGFAVRLPAAGAAALQAVPGVLSVRPAITVQATGVESPAPYNLDRIDQATPPGDGRFDFGVDAGRSAHVYVIDTGLNPNHAEFAGRVGASVNFVPELLFGVNPDDWGDCNGHGTHVSSTAVGTQYGVAKLATIHAVRALDCDGFGSNVDVLAALEWVLVNHQAPAVVNLSITSERDSSLDGAVRTLVASGISVVAAAGNSAADACGSSPAGELEVLSVGATDESDTVAPFSNVGPCVDLFAPGVRIPGADHASTGGQVIFNGTSMASPAVAGAVAILRSAQPQLTAAAAQAKVLQVATSGVVLGLGGDTANRLLYTAPLTDAPPVAKIKRKCRGLSCTFRAKGSSDDRKIKSFRWYFPGGKSVKGKTVRVTFGHAGRKKVRLVVTDSAGQRTTEIKKVKLKPRR